MVFSHKKDIYAPSGTLCARITPMQAAHSAHTAHTRDIRQKTEDSYLQKYPQYCYSEVCRYCGSAAHAHAPARHALSMGASSSSPPFSSSPPSSSWVNPRTTR